MQTDRRSRRQWRYPRGVLEVRIEGLPFGLGTHAQWDRKLMERSLRQLWPYRPLKGLKLAWDRKARRPGSQVHDPIMYDEFKKADAITATNGQPITRRT